MKLLIPTGLSIIHIASALRVERDSQWILPGREVGGIYKC